MRRLLGIAGLLIAFAAAVPQADAHKVPRLSLSLSLAQVLDQLRRDSAAVPASDPMPIDTVMKRHADTRGQSFDIASPDPEQDPSEAVPPRSRPASPMPSGTRCRPTARAPPAKRTISPRTAATTTP